jgi:hypothetical protein
MASGMPQELAKARCDYYGKSLEWCTISLRLNRVNQKVYPHSSAAYKPNQSVNQLTD